jgi:prepilin-type N-terminal cleavage/methylation domain-containing protein
MRDKRKNSTGFTLIELLMVIAIIALISSIVFIGYRERERHFVLQRSVHILAQDIRRVQEMAMRAEDFQGTVSRGGFGIQFESGAASYILFADCNRNQSFDTAGIATNCAAATSAVPFPEKLERRVLERDVLITSVNPNPSTIVFIPPDPGIRINAGAVARAAITLGIIIDGMLVTQRVVVNSAGLIIIE